jgi:predicted RNase H-like HicB family nuclease
MQFYALVEEWPGESILFFRELPGCFASAATTEAALQAAPAAIEKYFRWLKTNDLVIVEGEINPITVVLTERLSSKDKHGGPLFAADRVEPNELEIDNALNVSATARALIIEIATSLPTHLLEQSLTPDSWPLTQHLQHVMESENWYVSRLQEHPDRPDETPAMSADDMAMKIFENAMDNEIILHDLTPEQRSQILVHKNEEWTAAKVLRRQSEHLYEHLLCMEEIQAQLTSKH